MNVLSLFDGMSCGRMALTKLGIEPDNYFSSEVDTGPIKVANKNYPQDADKRLGDIRKVNGLELPPIDLLIGGSSCTDFSFAGTSKGMMTTDNIEVTTYEQYIDLRDSGFSFHGQSYLFWEYVRLVKETKPKYFMLENVFMDKKWEDIISNTLGVKPLRINSTLMSAQIRKRLYWTNIPNITQPEDQNIKLESVLQLDKEGLDKFYVTFNENQINKFNKVNTPLDKSNCLTTAIGRGGSSGEYLSMVKKVTSLCEKVEGKYRKITPLECERLQTVPDNYSDCVSNSARYKMLGNGWTVDVIKHIFSHI
jgi:DNA (cytosine-5)-methyltransferase 3A